MQILSNSSSPLNNVHVRPWSLWRRSSCCRSVLRSAIDATRLTIIQSVRILRGSMCGAFRGRDSRMGLWRCPKFRDFVFAFLGARFGDFTEMDRGRLLGHLRRDRVGDWRWLREVNGSV